MLTVACVLFISMGLEGAIRGTLGFGFKIFSCPKCLTFWSVLALSVCRGCTAVECVAVSFLCSYAALWLSLSYDALAILYNRLYDGITTQAATEKADTEAAAEAGSDALP